MKYNKHLHLLSESSISTGAGHRGISRIRISKGSKLICIRGRDISLYIYSLFIHFTSVYMFDTICITINKLEHIGPATRCDEMGHFAAILKLLEPSQTIAAYRRYLLQNRSSVASQLPTMECFHILLRCSSQR